MIHIQLLKHQCLFKLGFLYKPNIMGVTTSIEYIRDVIVSEILSDLTRAYPFIVIGGRGLGAYHPKIKGRDWDIVLLNPGQKDKFIELFRSAMSEHGYATTESSGVMIEASQYREFTIIEYIGQDILDVHTADEFPNDIELNKIPRQDPNTGIVYADLTLLLKLLQEDISGNKERYKEAEIAINKPIHEYICSNFKKYRLYIDEDIEGQPDIKKIKQLLDNIEYVICTNYNIDKYYGYLQELKSIIEKTELPLEEELEKLSNITDIMSDIQVEKDQAIEVYGKSGIRLKKILYRKDLIYDLLAHRRDLLCPICLNTSTRLKDVKSSLNDMCNKCGKL